MGPLSMRTAGFVQGWIRTRPCGSTRPALCSLSIRGQGRSTTGEWSKTDMHTLSSDDRSTRDASHLIWGGILLTILGLGGFGWYQLFGPGRFAEFEAIKARLDALPGVELVNASGHDDLGFEIHGFEVNIEGRGPLHLGAIDLDDFRQANRIQIDRIGNHVVTYAMEGYIGTYRADTGEPTRSEGWGWGFDIGPGGRYSHLFPFEVNNVEDVIERYEDICRVLETWPVQPEYGTFQDAAGVRYFYAVQDPALPDPWLHPEELKNGRTD